MTPIKLIRSIGKIVRGGAGPRQVFLGCLLGVMIGITPVFNLTLVIGIVLLLLLNANFGLTMLGLAIGKALMYALAPVTFAIGHVLIEGVAGGMFTALAETPVLALLGPEHYCLVGGLVIGAVVGAVLGAVLAKTIVSVRRGVLAARDRSEKVDKAGRNIFLRIVLRLVFGKLKKPLAEAMEAKDPLVRKSGVIIVVVMVALIVGGELLLANVFFRDMLQDGLAGANGAQVDIEAASLSVLGGSLEIKGLQVTDRDKPTHNTIQLDSLVGDISLSDLLAGRFVLTELSAKAPRMDVERDKAGEVFPAEDEGEGGQDGSAGDEEEDKATQERKEREQLDALAKELERRIKGELDKLTGEYVDKQIDTQLARLAKLPDSVRAEAKKKVDVEVSQRIAEWTDQVAKEAAERLIEQIKKQDRFAGFADEALKYRKYLPHVNKLRKKLAERKAAKDNSEERKQQLADRARAQGYLALRANLVSRPPWLIGRVAFEDFSFGKGGTYDLIGTNISSRPELSDEPMDLRITRRGGFGAELKFGFADGAYFGPDLAISFTLKLGDVSGGKLPEWVSSLSFDCRLTGGLKATPKLDVDTDKALADLRSKVADNIEAEVTKRVEKALKDQTGGLLKKLDLKDLLKGKDGKKLDLKDLLKGKDGKKPDPKDLLKGVLDKGILDKGKDDKKKPDVGGLLKGILGGDKDKDKDKDKKEDKLRDAARELL